jgi:SAM-dependent methyltransferase
MSSPAPWHTIGRHDVLPAAQHDDMARFDVIAHLNARVAQVLAPKVKAAYDSRARQGFRLRHGRDPLDRHDVAEAMQREPAYRIFSLVRRNNMEIRQHAGRQLVAREAASLCDRARALNEGATTLQLDPALEPPRYVSAVDTHLMRGGYTAERMADDVTNPANYDAGMYATTGGAVGPWNDAAGRALVEWLKREHPQFKPRRIVDLGCGLGHNTLPLRAAFPEAEIIAIDVAAPMLRYGHARARSLGVSDITFMQADATSAPVEENSCDLVFTTMVLHETSRQALPRFFSEAHRLLRAGGLTVHLEQPPYRGLDPFEQFMRDWDGRFNNEPFWSALHESDLPALLVKAGFGAHNVFESRCSALPPSQSVIKNEDFGRAPSWYVVGAWQAAKGIAAIG